MVLFRFGLVLFLWLFSWLFFPLTSVQIQIACHRLTCCISFGFPAHLTHVNTRGDNKSGKVRLPSFYHSDPINFPTSETQKQRQQKVFSTAAITKAWKSLSAGLQSRGGEKAAQQECRRKSFFQEQSFVIQESWTPLIGKHRVLWSHSNPHLSGEALSTVRGSTKPWTVVLRLSMVWWGELHPHSGQMSLTCLFLCSWLSPGR